MSQKAQLPKIHWIPTSNEQFRNPWNQIRIADLLLKGEPSSCGDAPSSDSAALVAPFNPAVAVSDIRLLSPEITPRADGPVYVAVFRQWEDDVVLVAPFSPYALPATTTELLLPCRRSALRVFCPWNTRSVSPADIAKSWFIDDLSDVEMADIWHIFRHAATGRAVPADLLPRVGCRIKELDDLRCAYQDEEVDRWAMGVHPG